MKFKDRKVSKALWKVFWISCVILFAALFREMMSETETLQGIVQNPKIMLLRLFIIMAIWGGIAVLIMNSMTIASDFEYAMKWWRRDRMWLKERVEKLEGLLKLSETELRKKVEQSTSVNIKIDGAEYQAIISTSLIPIENVKLLLEKSRDSLKKQYQEKVAPKEPKSFRFWKKTLSLFLEKFPETQNGY